MIDFHLINVALTGLGIGAAAVVLIAAAILVVAAFGRRGTTAHQPQVTPAGVVDHERIGEPVLR
jgi:hypothetical protein